MLLLMFEFYSENPDHRHIVSRRVLSLDQVVSLHVADVASQDSSVSSALS